MASDIVVPTDKSIPPETITSVIPTASTALTEACSPTVNKLAGRMNEGLIIVMMPTTAINKITGPKLSKSFQISAGRRVPPALCRIAAAPFGSKAVFISICQFRAAVISPVRITFVVIPFGDTISIAGHRIGLEAANLNAGALYLLATIGLGVYGVALAGWSSNNRWALLGGIRATAQMISYELAMGLAIVSVIMTFGTLNLQEIVRGQGGVWFGFLPRWGIFMQPLAFILLLVAGAAESKRIPFDLPESESELIQGYFTEYSGGKQAVFMLTDDASAMTGQNLVVDAGLTT